MFLRLFSRKHSPKRKGLTLVELILTISIIAILAGIIFLALDPLVRLQEARYSTALQDAGEITKAIHLFANDVGKEPGDLDDDDDNDQKIPTEGRMSRMNICMPGHAGNIVPDYCVNLDELVEEGFLPHMPIYDEPDGRMPNVTGFSVYAHGGFWEVLPGQVFVPRALQFDGTDDYVFTDIPSGYTGLDLKGPGAISLWIKPTAPGPDFQTDYTGLIMKGMVNDPAGNMNYQLQSNYYGGPWPGGSCTTCGSSCPESCTLPRCCVSPDVPDGSCLSISDPTNGQSCISNDPIRGGYCDLVTNGSCVTAENVQTRTGLVANKWQLVVLAWNSEKIAVYQRVIGGGTSEPNRYRDFEFSGGGTNLPVPIPGQDLFIGARVMNNGHFKGLIDDVRIYDRFLTATDVSHMMNDTLEDDPIDSLLQQYTFNDNPLQTIVRADTDRYKANAVRTYKTSGNGPPLPEKEISPPWVHILRGCDQDEPGPCL